MFYGIECLILITTKVNEHFILKDHFDFSKNKQEEISNNRRKEKKVIKTNRLFN